MTGADIFATLGVDPSNPARTLRMVCDALAAAHAGKSVIVVCGNRAEVERIQRATIDVARKAVIPMREVALRFVEVSRDPRRYLRGTRGVQVFVDHFAAQQRGAIGWFEMAEQRR